MCLSCEKEIPGRGKKYCSISCQQDFQHKEKVRKWLNGDLDILVERSSSRTIQRYLRELHGDKCSLCGWCQVNPYTGRVPVEVDHIDGNASNNHPDNLRLICPNCHSLTNTFRGLNRGSGRSKRYLPI